MILNPVGWALELKWLGFRTKSKSTYLNLETDKLSCYNHYLVKSSKNCKSKLFKTFGDKFYPKSGRRDQGLSQVVKRSKKITSAGKKDLRTSRVDVKIYRSEVINLRS